MPYRTLEALRTELSARLGMGGMGASGGASLSLLNSFLRNGQDQLYRMQDWRHLTVSKRDKLTDKTAAEMEASNHSRENWGCKLGENAAKG